MVFYEPDHRDRELLPHDPFKAFVAPRPIGWVSTVGPDGEVNLAPYSYFNAVSDNPPTVMFSSDGPKDSSTYAGATEEFVWNLVTYDLREAMNQTSAALPRGENEFAFAGLEMAPSRLVAPPRVAASPVAFECRVIERVQLARNIVTFGQVVGVHVDERHIVDGRFDTAGVRPIARCGYRGDYATVTELFEMIRP
jgi:flavin reductase (DIM6/NTAB) family NADH-FMN oxidoreductase RutF